jgi:hypothetical protein
MGQRRIGRIAIHHQHVEVPSRNNEAKETIQRSRSISNPLSMPHGKRRPLPSLPASNAFTPFSSVSARNSSTMRDQRSSPKP